MTININFDTGSTSKEELNGLAALISHVAPVALPTAALREHQRNLYSRSAIGYGDKLGGTPIDTSDRDYTFLNAKDDDNATDDKVETRPTPTTVIARERGKPAPGRARRTKEEIAEDEAADKADAAGGGTQAISTGGERVNPEDDEATQAADRADEEAEENQTEAAPLTVMDGKTAMGAYVNKFGMAAAQEDGMSIFIAALGTPPAGAKGWGWTMLAEANDQAKIDTVVKAWQAAAAAPGRFGA